MNQYGDEEMKNALIIERRRESKGEKGVGVGGGGPTIKVGQNVLKQISILEFLNSEEILQIGTFLSVHMCHPSNRARIHNNAQTPQ